jgi:hypothetical protein
MGPEKFRANHVYRVAQHRAEAAADKNQKIVHRIIPYLKPPASQALPQAGYARKRSELAKANEKAAA